jgi:hypothetical protein
VDAFPMLVLAAILAALIVWAMAIERDRRR